MAKTTPEPPWTIERIVPGGEGLARLHDGRVGFAAGTAPGDVISVSRVQAKKSFARARKYELLTPGPARIVPECAHAKKCGGCDLMHLSREAELEAKRGILQQALKRTGGFHELAETPPEIRSGQAVGYRMRMRVHIGRSGSVGLYALHSHMIVAIDHCLVASDALNAGLSTLEAAAQAHDELVRSVGEVEIRVDESDCVHFHAVARQGVDPARAQVAMASALGPASTSVLGAGTAGEDQLYSLTGTTKLHAAPAAFTQVNWEVNRMIISDIVAEAKARQWERFVDLYCGAGNFTLPLLAAGLKGIGVDRDGAGLRSARRGAAAQGLDESVFVGGDVLDRLADVPAELIPVDLLILDPPRSGAKDAIDAIARLRASWVAYVSCDPVTLARDAKNLANHGYSVTSVRGYDMFPRTHHFETVMWLQAR